MNVRSIGAGFLILLVSIVCVLAVTGETASRPIKRDGSSAIPPPSRTHNVGLLALRVSNAGIFGSTLEDGRNARWREYEHLYLSGAWVGAIGADQLPHVSTAEAFEFASIPEPGLLIFESYEGQPGGFRTGLFGASYGDDDGDGAIDEDFQNGLDDDGDGRTDEDFAAIGQQMFSSTYRDNTSSFPLGLLVKQRSFQWSVAGINELVGFDLQVINDGDTDLTDLYLGVYCDADIGPAGVPGYGTDDLAGWDQIDTTLFSPGPGDPCYTSLSLSAKTLFTWDALDNGSSATGGDAPSVFGTVLTHHTTDVLGIRAPQQVDWRTVTWISNPKSAVMTDPDRYALLASGEKPVTHPRSGVANGSTSDPGDYATLLSVGPFPVLHPGESATLSGAYVAGDGFPGYRSNVARAERIAATQHIDLDNDPITGLAGKERCLRALEGGEPVVWNNPCDTLAAPIEWSSTECMWVDLDCNPCTGIYGAETLWPWVGSVAPPYPNSNLDPVYVAGLPPQQTLVVPPAGDGQVTVQWDNLGELWIDQITGQKTFYGYRIWKVSDWTGSGVPDPEDWIQLAEFTLNIESEDYLGNIVNRDVDPIGTTPDGTPIYPVGRYAFIDSEVTNGNTYFYCVTSFSRRATNQGHIEYAALPWTTEDRAVVPCDLCNPVPVRLVSFTAERAAGRVQLSWTTQDQGDLSGFHVAREVIGTAGRVRISDRLLSGGQNYEFFDEHAPAGPVDYWLEAFHRDGTQSWHGPAHLAAGPVPAVFSVRFPAPNPFNMSTRLAYELPDSRSVRILVHDLSGRRIRVLLYEEQGPGSFSVHWNGESDSGQRAAPGLYILSVEAGQERISRELLLLR